MVRKESDEMVGENPHASGSGQVRMHHQPEGLIRADLRLQALQAAGPRHKVRQDAQSEARGYCGNLGHERIGFDFTRPAAQGARDPLGGRQVLVSFRSPHKVRLAQRQAVRPGQTVGGAIDAKPHRPQPL